MKKEHIAWILSDGAEGSPVTSHFWGAVLEVVLSHLDRARRFERLSTAWAHADMTHKHLLRQVLPDTLIEAVERSWGMKVEAPASLDVLPGLLVMALPELQMALMEYASQPEYVPVLPVERMTDVINDVVRKHTGLGPLLIIGSDPDDPERDDVDPDRDREGR